MNIGSVIKSKRREKDLTQEQLAEYLNVSVSAVSQWESGKTVPDVSLIITLANFFDVTTDELLCRTAKKDEIGLLMVKSTSIEEDQQQKGEAYWLRITFACLCSILLKEIRL